MKGKKIGATALFILGLLTVLSPGLLPRANASHVTCSTQSTHVFATWNPPGAPGVSVSIVAIACGTLDTDTGHFQSTHHQVECSVGGATLDNFSFSGTYTYTGVKQNGHNSYTFTNSTSTCLPIIDSSDFGPFQPRSKQPENVFTDFSMTVVYLPNGAQNTLVANARDCAVSPGGPCPA